MKKAFFLVVIITLMFFNCAPRKTFVTSQEKMAEYLALIEEYSLPENFIEESMSFDESIIIKNNSTCDFESLVRKNFNNYQIHHKNSKEIWFYNFIKNTKTTVAGDFYLLELYTVNFSNDTSILCSVKYFESFEKRIGKIKNSNLQGNGINNLRNLIKNCND